MNDWIPTIFGYGYAILVGHFCIKALVDKLWPPEAERPPAAYLPAIEGCLERGLFLASLQLQMTGFIGVWLALKAAGRWKRWDEGHETQNQKFDGRIFYHIFLIGSGLSVAYAAVAHQLIKSLKSPDTRRLIFIFSLAAALVVGTFALRCYADKKRRTSGVQNGPNANSA